MIHKNVFQHIAENMNQLSKSHKKIANYLLKNANMVPFFKVATLAKKAGVSEATVVRFATTLGYSGYPEMQQHMQNSIQQQLTTMDRLKLSSQVYDDKEKVIYDIFNDDISNIKATMENLDVEAFHRAAQLLLNAKKIYISANRSTASLGIFLHYYLNIILENSELLGSFEVISEHLYNLNEDDVVIGISFARYSSSTINTVAFAKDMGASTISITDNLLSPLFQHSDVTLTAASDMPSFIDSFTAPLSLINALIVYLGKEREKEVEIRLTRMEEIWSKFGSFYKKET
ncbi:MurR/RpiR family transcriptional regulator [Sporosarcina sp. ACRSL]|uniref:MurR/RpiR family transcriptional regulator n=1 Tax=Sporosarcina sp. ACRSL TaxID=2918215 RepID=UPI001EF5BF11|nr:MurR/RpiR family transcriptional regulator [Sporosarcina sp. ACRSL]MCG7344116.1 MurR/RpiR family transcriptional regulator [Sporosarcina sp. ACRSL]